MSTRNEPGTDPRWTARWSAVCERAVAADGGFVYAVRTTGVFCHPSCPSRKPRPANVAFFETPGDALAAGYRPCKRCRPVAHDAEDPAVDRVVEACRLLTADTPATTSAVAEAVGWSERHLGRSFKRLLGVTPQQYARRVRAERARATLATGASVTVSTYEAGYASSSRFYEGVGQELGMTPSAARGGGVGELIRYAVAPCSLGHLLVAWTERGVCRVGFGDEPRAAVGELRAGFFEACLEASEASPWVEAVVAAVEHATPCEVPLDVRGTAFQERVWRLLRTLAVGTTTTYGDLARALDEPTAARAVARACATNPIAVAIPCHRVVGADGALRGYRWGLARKAELLRRERDR